MGKGKKTKRTKSAKATSPSAAKPSAAKPSGPDVSGAELAQRALEEPDARPDIEKQLDELTPEQAEMFVEILEITMKRRRWMLFGYLAAILGVLLGMLWALYIYGTRTPGTFVGWVFLIPPAFAGLMIYVFGKLSKRVKK